MKRNSLLSSFLGLASTFAFCWLPSPGFAQDPTIGPLLEDPPPPNLVTVTASDAEAAEPSIIALDPANARSDIAVFIVTRRGATDFDLPVHYSLGGTAENGVDYVKLPGLLTIPKGSTGARIIITPMGDILREGPETVSITLEPPVCPLIYPPPRECYQVGDPAAARAVILDAGGGTGDNLPPRVHIARPSSGQTFTAPVSLEVTAVAVDADGYAARAELYANQEKIGDSEIVFIRAPDPGTPLTHMFVWKDVPIGVHELVVVAFDDRGASSKSAPVQIIVGKEIDLPIVTLTAPDAEAAEPRTPLPNERLAINRGQIKVSRTGATTQPLQVFLALTGTAVNGTDYQRIPNTVLIPAGAESALVDVLPVNDLSIEPTETVVATLLPPIVAIDTEPVVTQSDDATQPPVIRITPYRVGEPRSATIRILDNGEGPTDLLPIVNVVATDAEATEPSTDSLALPVRLDEARFTITRTGPTSRPLSVFFRVGGTAAPGLDYVALRNTATIPAGFESVDVVIQPRYDRLKEPDEIVVISLIAGLSIIQEPVTTDLAQVPPLEPVRPGYRVGDKAEARAVIHDANVIVENRPPKATISSPLPGASFRVGALVTIEVQTADADGYVPWVEFFAGRMKIGDSRIAFIRAPDPGTLITHSFEWRDAPAGEHLLTAVAHDDGGAVTSTSPGVPIKVGGRNPRTIVTVKAADAEGAEPDPVPPGMGRPTVIDPLVFVFSREGDLTVPITVHYKLEGSATPGRDYEVASRVVEIPRGAASARLVITPIDDDLVEGEESVAVAIEPVACIAIADPPPSCYLIGDPGAARGIIKDNDRDGSGRPLVTLTAADAIAAEGRNEWTTPTATFVLSRSGLLDEELVVYLKASGTALAGKDYDVLPDKVVLPAGQRALRLLVKPIDDTEVEPIETVLLEVLPPESPIRPIGWPAYELGRPHRAAAVILDNDQKRPPCLRLPDGRFHVCLPALEGGRFRVESSGDLRDWTDLGPVEAAGGAVHYVDPEQAGSGARFYRVVPDTTTGLE